jgi:hypothetical protein
MYTLNEILTIIENQAAAHLQVKQYGQGDAWEINPKELDYLVLWAIEESVVLNERTLTYNIRLLAMDRVLPGEENEQEVMSDTIQVLLDFVAYFRQLHTTDLSIQTSVSFEPFTERFDDKVSGHACVLSITQPYDYNKCQIPQTTNTIPPTVDGITLYDFCNQATLDRLTPVQIACLEAAFGLACDDATVQLNGTTVGTIPSGDSDSFTVNLDGSPSGVWDGTAWQVTSAPCDDATIELNGVEMTTIPSGDTENITVLQSSGATQVGSKQGTHWRIDDSAISINGSPVADVKAEDSLDINVTQGGSPVGSWDGLDWIVPPCVNPSLTIGVYSDVGLTNPITTANFDDTIYIKLTATDITPTLYRFYVSSDGVDGIELFEQAGNTLAYNVFGLQDVVIYAEATDGSSIGAALTNTTITVTDTNADAFIAAHNTLSSLSMGSVQQQCVQDTYRMLKGSNTPNGNDLFAYHTANANTRFFPIIPVDDSTVNIAGYTLDIFHLATGSYGGFVLGDFSVNGVTGGNTKYFDSGASPSSLPIDNISCAIYSRTNFSGFDADFGATDVANSLNNSVRCETNNNFGMRFSLNDSTNTSVLVIDSLGLRLLNRVSTIKKGLDVNKLFGYQYVVATTSSPTATTYFHFINGYTTVFYYSRRQLCLYWQALGMSTSQIEDWKFIMNHIQKTVITGGRDV